MFSDGFRICDWEKEKMIELVKYMTIENAKDEGKQEGIIQGKQESLLKMIKSMLNKNFSFKTISEITGKSINEIKESM